jgi:hypothetical protein
MHEDSEADSPLPEAVRQAIGVGPTGEFMGGKLRPDDRGGLRIAVAREGYRVILDFGITVKWLGLTAGQAVELSDVLRAKAVEILAQKENVT